MGMYGALAQGAIQLHGEAAAQQEKEKQRRLLQKLLDQIQGIQTPDLEAIDPEQVSQLPDEDPALRAAQMRSFQGLQDVADSGGLRMEDLAAQNQLLNGVSRQQNAMRSRALESMTARGMGGSGAELAASLQGAQDAGARASEQGLSLAGQAQRRALDAMMQGGQLAGNMSQQDLRRAQAKNVIDQYNAEQRSRAKMYNTNGRKQQMYGNALQKTGQLAGATTGLGTYYGNNAADTRNAAAGYGAAAGEAVKQGMKGTAGNSNGGYSGGTDYAGNQYDPSDLRYGNENWKDE